VLGEPVIFDYDGDGELEAIVAGIPSNAGVDEWRGHEWREAWAFHAGRWQPYAAARTFALAGVVDADGDGRPDFLTRGPYESVHVVSGMAGAVARAVPPMFVAHALPSRPTAGTQESFRSALGWETIVGCPKRR